MKTPVNSMRWLGLALACATVTFAATLQAAKPPAPSGPAYTAVVLGGLREPGGQIVGDAADINSAGQVVGYTAIPSLSWTTYSQGFLINPRDVNSDGKLEWFVDADGDGQNDLIIPLGTLPARADCGRHCSAAAVNDLGLVLGVSSEYDFNSRIGIQKAFILVPLDTDNNGRADCWFQDLNGDGFNDLMIPLGRPPGVPESFVPNDLNMNNAGQVTGYFHDPSGVSPSVGFLLTPVSGVWFLDDGSGANALMLNLGDFLPLSINDNGQVVGASAASAALLRNPDGSLIELTPGGTVSVAEAINDLGQIGVWWQVNGVGHAGLLTPLDWNNDGQVEWYRDANGDGINDLIVDCGNLKGLENSYLRPHTLNDSGSIAGGSWHASRDGVGYQRAAWLWKNGVLQSLQSLTGGTTEIRDAYAINNAGQVICQASGTRSDPSLKTCILLPTR